MNKELIEAKRLIDELFACGEAIIKKAKAAQPSDQHLLDDGWIRHTGDVCPVPALEEVRYIDRLGSPSELAYRARALNWSKDCGDCGIAHYKVTKTYAPHAESKELYAKDAVEHKEPWKLWELRYLLDPRGWGNCSNEGYMWRYAYEYRRKQIKELVDWSCPLLKGANTNLGEILLCTRSNNGVNTVYVKENSNSVIRVDKSLLRLASTSDWQAYNGEDLNLPQEAGFVVEVKYFTVTTDEYVVVEYRPDCNDTSLFASYRVIALRDGFTDNPADVV